MKLRKTNVQIEDINKTINETAKSITDTILPSTQKVMELKQQVCELYRALGNSPLQSEYKTLMDAKELDYIGPVVTQMVQESYTIKKMHADQPRSLGAQIKGEDLIGQTNPNSKEAKPSKRPYKKKGH